MKSLTSNWRRSVVFFICISIRRNVFFHHLLTFIHSLPLTLSLSLAIFLIINLFEFDNRQEYSRWLPQIYFICTKFRANKLTTSIRNRCCVCVTFFYIFSSVAFSHFTHKIFLGFFSIRFVLDLWTMRWGKATFELDYECFICIVCICEKVCVCVQVV